MANWKQLANFLLSLVPGHLLIEREMAPKAQVPRRYTSEELLALRGSLPFVTCVIKNLNQHPDLGMCTCGLKLSWHVCVC